MLKARLLTAAVLIPGFLAALFLLSPLFWSILILIICALALWEWATMAKFSPVLRSVYVFLVFLLGLLGILVKTPAINTWFMQLIFWGILASSLFWLFFSPIWLIMRFQIQSKFCLALIGLVLIVPTWLALISLRSVSPWLLLELMVTVWIADSAAYFSGKHFGKHKLAPAISPGKTWEGVAGAILAVIIYSVMLSGFSLPNHGFGQSIWLAVGLLAITLLSIIGDLFESLIKRQAGVKDSGVLLPGHGGILDRIDGLMSTLPLATFFVY